jgi:hypothetical protein
MSTKDTILQLRYPKTGQILDVFRRPAIGKNDEGTAL